MSAEQLTAARWWFLKLSGMVGYGAVLTLHALGHEPPFWAWIVPTALIHPRILEALDKLRPGK